MEKDNNALTDRVAKLEQTAADHERRVAALEVQLGPKPKQQTPGSSLDEALSEFNEFVTNFPGFD